MAFAVCFQEPWVIKGLSVVCPVHGKVSVPTSDLLDFL